jgi:uncharacterized protein YycO
MAKLIVFFIILYSMSIHAAKLKTGDILLQPLSCWSCSLIEQQENSLYSHIGVYLELDGEGYVFEALGDVNLVTLKQFKARTKKGSNILVRRHVKSDQILNFNIKEVVTKYLGKPYDKNYLWNNYYNGKEAFYCSELVFKFFNNLNLIKNTKLKRMPFDINPSLWDRFFKGQTPRGEIGSSPEDFNKSLDFRDVSFL